MLTIIEAILGSGLFLAAISFVFSLGTRVTALETNDKTLAELLDLHFDPINQRLDRIERSMNGFLHKE